MPMIGGLDVDHSTPITAEGSWYANMGFSKYTSNNDPVRKATQAAMILFLTAGHVYSDIAQQAIAMYWQNTNNANAQLDQLQKQLNLLYLPEADTADAAIAQLRALNGLAPLNPALKYQNQYDAVINSAKNLTPDQSAAVDQLKAAWAAVTNASSTADATAALSQFNQAMKATQSSLANNQLSAQGVADQDFLNKYGEFGTGYTAWINAGMPSPKGLTIGEAKNPNTTLLNYIAGVQNNLQNEKQLVTDRNNFKASLQDFNSSNPIGKLDPTKFAATPANEIEAMVRAQPGYQFQYDQGQQAINAQAAASGHMYSGNQLAALQQRGQDTADSFFQQYQGNLASLAAQTLGFKSGMINMQGAIGAAKNANYMNATGFQGSTDVAIAQNWSNQYNAAAQMFQQQAATRLASAGGGSAAAAGTAGQSQVAQINAQAQLGSASIAAGASNQNNQLAQIGAQTGQYMAGQAGAGQTYQQGAISQNANTMQGASSYGNQQIGQTSSYF